MASEIYEITPPIEESLDIDLFSQPEVDTPWGKVSLLNMSGEGLAQAVKGLRNLNYSTPEAA